MSNLDDTLVSREIIEFTIQKSNRGTMYLTASIGEEILRNNYAPAILRAFAEKVVDKMVEQYVAEHGAEILSTLAPEVLANQIRTGLETRIARFVFGDLKI